MNTQSGRAGPVMCSAFNYFFSPLNTAPGYHHFSKREKRESQNTSIFLVLLYDAGLIPGKQNYHVSSVLNALVIV